MEDAVDVVDLVLQRLRQQRLRRLDADFFTFAVPGLHRHRLRAGDLRLVPGHRKAPLISRRSPDDFTTCGLITAISPSSGVSITTTRSDTPTCGAARPTPGAACIVSIISSISLCSSASILAPSSPSRGAPDRRQCGSAGCPWSVSPLSVLRQGTRSRLTPVAEGRSGRTDKPGAGATRRRGLPARRGEQRPAKDARARRVPPHNLVDVGAPDGPTLRGSSLTPEAASNGHRGGATATDGRGRARSSRAQPA